MKVHGFTVIHFNYSLAPDRSFVEKELRGYLKHMNDFSINPREWAKMPVSKKAKIWIEKTGKDVFRMDAVRGCRFDF